MNRYKNLVLIITITTVIMAACKKMDDYRSKYESDGAINYAGKMDSVRIFSGNYRVQVNGLLTSDPNIVEYRVFTNSRQDSIAQKVKRTAGVDTVKLIIPNLEEGTQSFEIRTYDADGNPSVPVFVTANVYGKNYQSSIINRGVVDASLQNDGSALITWADVSSDAGVQNMRITYTDTAGVAHDTTIKSIASKLTTTLPAIKVGSTFSYRTAFLPNPTAIDTFYTAYQPHSVKADVTAIYLSNYGPGFQRDLFDGRFGTLGAPWITNAGAKNKDGGTIGGYAADEGGVINWETWGNTPVVDGKVYQVTSAPLPAGTYTVVYTYYSEVQQNSTVFCIAAAGNTGIPSLSNLSAALGSSAMFNGANVGATSPNVQESKSFDFTITTPQYVSIGFLGNIVGDGNPGSYFQVKSIQLIQN